MRNMLIGFLAAIVGLEHVGAMAQTTTAPANPELRSSIPGMDVPRFRLSSPLWTIYVSEDGSGYIGVGAGATELQFGPKTFDFQRYVARLKAKVAPVGDRGVGARFVVQIWEVDGEARGFVPKDSEDATELFEAFRQACKRGDSKNPEGDARFEDAWRNHPPTAASKKWDDPIPSTAATAASQPAASAPSK